MNTPTKIMFNLGLVKAGTRLRVVVDSYPLCKCVPNAARYRKFIPKTIEPIVENPVKGWKDTSNKADNLRLWGISFFSFFSLPNHSSEESSHQLIVLRLDHNKYGVVGGGDLNMEAVLCFDVENTSGEDLVAWVEVVGDLELVESSGLLATVRRAISRAREIRDSLVSALEDSIEESIGEWVNEALAERRDQEFSRHATVARAGAGFGPILIDARDDGISEKVTMVVVRFAKPFVPKKIMISPEHVTSFTITDLRVRERIEGAPMRVLLSAGAVREGKLYGRSAMLNSSPLPGIYFAVEGGSISCGLVRENEELCIFVQNRDPVPTAFAGAVVGDVVSPIF